MKSLRSLSSGYAPDQALFYLTAERSLSAAGRLSLSEWELQRSSGRAQANPPVLSLSDLARKILRFYEQCVQQWQLPTRKLTDIELISKLRALDDTLGPREALDECRYIEIFEKLGLQPLDWGEVIEGLEEHKKDPDFSDWSQRILRYLQCKAQVVGDDQNRALLSAWQQVEFACNVLQSQEPVFWNWGRILSLANTTADPDPVPRIFFILNCELFPSEKKILDLLIRAGAPIEVVDYVQAQSELTEAEILKLPSHEMSEESHLVWALFSKSPGSAAWTQTLPTDIALDVPLAREPGSGPLCRALRLWAQFFSDNEPRFHPFRQNPEHKRRLSERGMNCAAQPTTHDLVRCLLADKNFLRPELLEIANDPAPVVEWLDVLTTLGYFDEESGRTETLAHSQIHSQGKRIYALKDLVLGFSGEVLLFSRAKELNEILNEKSLDWASERILPHRISRLLERGGFRVPEPSREAGIHRALVGSLRGQVALAKVARIETQVAEDDQATAPGENAIPAFRSHAKRAHHSASSFELLLQCPYKFFARHHLGIKSRSEADPIKIDPMSQGNWLHFALEKFFQAPDWNDPETLIKDALNSQLDKAFNENASAEYKEFLRRQIPNFTERLARHLRLFEEPLFKAAAPQKSLTEFAFKTRFLDQEFNGRIDRLDLLGNNRALIWDYKTGGGYTGTPASLIKKGKIQWFLYREILELKAAELGLGEIKIVGGGFLNPLDPSRSQAYLFSDLAPKALAEFGVAAYPLRVIPTKEEKEISFALKQQLEVIRGRLDSNLYLPEPLDKTLCKTCDALSACGRPYLSEDRA